MRDTHRFVDTQSRALRDTVPAKCSLVFWWCCLHTCTPCCVVVAGRAAAHWRQEMLDNQGGAPGPGGLQSDVCEGRVALGAGESRAPPLPQAGADESRALQIPAGVLEMRAFWNL